MLNNSMLDNYNNKSILKNLKATTKIITLLITVIGIMASNFYGLLIFFILVSILIVISKIPIFVFLKQIITMKYLYLFLIIFSYFNNTLFYEGIFIITRIILVIIISSLLTLTTKPEEITEGLKILLSPLKVFNLKTDKIALILSLAISFIPTTILQIERILKALKSKGLDFKEVSLIEKIKIVQIMLLPVFVLSMDKAETVADAMEVRLYENRKINYTKTEKTKIMDYVYLTVHIAIVLVIFR